MPLIQIVDKNVIDVIEVSEGVISHTFEYKRTDREKDLTGINKQ